MDGATAMDEQVEVPQDQEEGQQVPRKMTAAWERGQKRRRSEVLTSPSRWKSPGEQQRYSSRVLDALRRVLSRGAASPPASNDALRRRRAVREAADRALAIAAGGRTRWSRAILSSCRALKLRKKRRAVDPRYEQQRKARPPPSVAAAEEEAGAIARKVRLLGRIVPGCRRLPLPSLLEEASDYIAALELQVRAMSALAKALSSADGGSTTSGHR